jgi:hypothetical protein
MIEFSWNVKYLKEDERGYASTFFCEMNGVLEGITKTANSVFSFGGDDYKPKSQWTQEQIDQWAEIARSNLEEQINAKFNN